MTNTFENRTNKKIIPVAEGKDYYRLCPGCGNFSHINENHTYCSVCGEKLIEECPGCKAKIENPVAAYCVKCGRKIKNL